MMLKQMQEKLFLLDVGGKCGALLQGCPVLPGVQTVAAERPAHRPLSSTGPHAGG